MNPARLLLPLASLALLAAVGAQGALASGSGGSTGRGMAGVANPEQARVDYMLKCQGCHQPDGSGDMAHTPPLKGAVAQFLHVPGGRQFLGRVPGVASTDLSDVRLAQLLNWTVQRFDPAHLPGDFQPYSTQEISELRRVPLRLERAETRARLVAAIEEGAPTT
ncbi:MAG: cytochrome C [Sphingomonadales bacterium]|nr:cytochrome C [Sphingomonadales bacterium]MBD3772587.1 cytochrome C [Paracoccaceae bacterium]